MSEILIFGGTTEGRILAEFCAGNGIKACVSVTTDYGAELLPQNKNIKIIVGKLDYFQIKQLISENIFEFIIDATHPYALLATQNIKAACDDMKIKYYRIVRETECQIVGKASDNLSDIIEYLNCGSKRILSVLGSKELSILTKINNYKERVWVRVIPAEGIAEYCEKLAFDKNKIIIGKGPFSFEENVQHIKTSGAEILVTKECGTAGGYPQKVQAAMACGIEIVTLKRPAESGLSIKEMQKIIYKKGEVK